MTILTAENYYDKGNRALTCSKIKDYIKCPNYFYRKHILCEIVDDEKPAFIFGGIVDKLLSNEDFDKNYEVADGIRTAKLKKEAAERGVTLITKNDYNEIFEVADAIEQTDAWKFIKTNNFVFQDILQQEMELGEHFDSLAGKPDIYGILNDVCYLVDVKTAVTIDLRRYFYMAHGFHYDYQLANYETLLKLKFPNIKEFRSFNLVASKEKNFYGVELFEYPRSVIEKSKEEMAKLIVQISKEKEFKKYNPSFEAPKTLDISNQYSYSEILPHEDPEL